jgi:hypothetical protein
MSNLIAHLLESASATSGWARRSGRGVHGLHGRDSVTLPQLGHIGRHRRGWR